MKETFQAKEVFNVQGVHYNRASGWYMTYQKSDESGKGLVTGEGENTEPIIKSKPLDCFSIEVKRGKLMLTNVTALD